MTVAVLSAYTSGQHLLQNSGPSKQFDPSNVTGADTDDELWKMLESGAVDVVYTVKSVADEFLYKRWKEKSSPHFYASGQKQSVNRQLDGYPFAGQHAPEDPYASAHEWQPPSGSLLRDKDIFFDICGGRCRGGPSFECIEGRSGRLYSSCAVGWASMLGECTECNNDWKDYLIGIGGTVCVVLVWMMLNAMTATKFNALDMLLEFAQILSIVQVSLSLSPPPSSCPLPNEHQIRRGRRDRR